jgi:hypothetical protein
VCFVCDMCVSVWDVVLVCVICVCGICVCGTYVCGMCVELGECVCVCVHVVCVMCMCVTHRKRVIIGIGSCHYEGQKAPCSVVGHLEPRRANGASSGLGKEKT